MSPPLPPSDAGTSGTDKSTTHKTRPLVLGSNNRFTLVIPCAGGVCRLMSPIQSRLHPYISCQNINLMDRFRSIEVLGRGNGGEERGTISPDGLVARLNVNLFQVYREPRQALSTPDFPVQWTMTRSGTLEGDPIRSRERGQLGEKKLRALHGCCTICKSGGMIVMKTWELNEESPSGSRFSDCVS